MYAILAVAAIGACVGWSNTKKGAAWGQPVTIVCAIIAIGIGFYLAVQNSFGANGATIERETNYQKIFTKKLGLYLKEKYPGKKLLLLCDPISDINNNPQIEGFKEGIGNDLEIVDILVPEPPKQNAGPEGLGMMEPMEVWFFAKDLDKLIGKKKFDMLVTFAGIPRGVTCAGKDFKNPGLKGKKVIIAAGSVYDWKYAIKEGAIPAAVSYKPNAVYDEKLPRNLDEAFDKRFVLITSDNIDTVANEYSQLFPAARGVAR